jgi:ParB-like chromosome segregation protein Spo0J
MRLERVPLARLKGAPYNPRCDLQPGSDGWKRLERSLDEFGLVQPIVWNERTGHVVGGHQRLAILRSRGVEEVEVAVVSLTAPREKALNVALNNPRVGGDWDVTRLTELVGELRGDPEIDETLTGFDVAELRQFTLEKASGPLAFDPPGADMVRVVLEVTPDEWERLRREIDRLIDGGGVTAHVRMPGDGRASTKGGT